jgi:hypothetical protein
MLVNCEGINCQYPLSDRYPSIEGQHFPNVNNDWVHQHHHPWHRPVSPFCDEDRVIVSIVVEFSFLLRMSRLPMTAPWWKTHRMRAGPVSKACHGLQHRMKQIALFSLENHSFTTEERQLWTPLPKLESGRGFKGYTFYLELEFGFRFYVRQVVQSI